MPYIPDAEARVTNLPYKADGVTAFSKYNQLLSTPTVIHLHRVKTKNTQSIDIDLTLLHMGRAETVSIRLVGDFGFLILRGSPAESQLCFCTAIADIHIEFNNDVLEIHGSRKSGQPVPGSLFWQSFTSNIRLSTLTVECNDTQIQLESLIFHSEAHLVVRGAGNVVAFSDCHLEKLHLRSEQPNQLDFRQQGALYELDAELHGSTMQARLRGSAWSSVASYHGSNVFLYIEPQHHSRTFDFTKDSLSQILVEGSLEPQRVITADHEQWDFGLKLQTIKLDTEQRKVTYELDKPGAEPPKGTPSCVICQSRVPSYLLEPCTHLGLCVDCAPQFKQYNISNCPYCRAPVEHIRQVFLTCT